MPREGILIKDPLERLSGEQVRRRRRASGHLVAHELVVRFHQLQVPLQRPDIVVSAEGFPVRAPHFKKEGAFDYLERRQLAV